MTEEDDNNGIISAKRSFDSTMFEGLGLSRRIRSTLETLAKVRGIGTSPEDREKRISAAIAEMEGRQFAEQYTIDELCKEAGEILKEKWEEDRGQRGGTPKGGRGA